MPWFADFGKMTHFRMSHRRAEGNALRADPRHCGSTAPSVRPLLLRKQRVQRMPGSARSAAVAQAASTKRERRMLAFVRASAMAMARARFLCMVQSPEQQIFCRETTDRRDNSFISENCVRIAATRVKNTPWMSPQTLSRRRSRGSRPSDVRYRNFRMQHVT